MTIEQKAREIAATVNKRYSLYYAEQEAARLGIIEGRRQAFEEAAARVRGVGTSHDSHAGERFAAAIRALIEEAK